MFLKRILLLSVIFTVGCTSVPRTPVDMSEYSTPTEGFSGVYFYQHKTGVFGSLYDVKYVVDKQVLGKINTGEWLYLEVPTGEHKYTFSGGFLPQYLPFTFAEKQNYFFRGSIFQMAPYVVWINDEEKIRTVIQNIESGRYEPGNLD